MLGSAELPILEALWEKGPLTGREIYERVRRSRELAYTTVLTIVGRMVKKGSIKRRKTDGMFVYEPAWKKPEFERRVATAVIKGIVEISPAHAVSAFVDVLFQGDAGRLDEVMRFIEERKKTEGR